MSRRETNMTTTTTNAVAEQKFQVKRAIGKRNGVSGVDMGRVDLAHLREVLVGVCKVPQAQVDGASPDHCTVLASNYFENHYAQKSKDPALAQVQCTGCGGVSGGLDVCPYCNDHDERVKGAVPVVAAKPSATEASESSGGKVGDDDAPRGASESGGGQEGKADDMAKQQATVKTDKNKKKGKAAEPAKANGHANGASVALATVRPESKAMVTCEVLDRQVAEVRRLRGEHGASAHALGKAIEEIVRTKSWSLRIGEGGKQAFRSFEAFSQAELGINPQYALVLMDVSKAYTPEQAATWGVKKCSLVLEAPPEARPALEGKLDQGASRREIEAEVRRARKDADYTKPSRDGVDRKPNKGAKARVAAVAAAKPREEKVTVASLLGSQTLKAYKRPEGKLDLKALKQAPRAKTLGDEPFAVYEAENGVVFLITAKKDKEGLAVIHVACKRVEE